MAYTALTVSTANGFGGSVLDIAATAADGTGNSFANDGKAKLIVVNGGGSNCTVTVVVPAGPYSLNAAGTKTHVVVNGKTAIIGPFPPAIYNQSTGVVNVDYSQVTSVTVAVVNHNPTPII